jgi:hypothetical protein
MEVCAILFVIWSPRVSLKVLPSVVLLPRRDSWLQLCPLMLLRGSISLSSDAEDVNSSDAVGCMMSSISIYLLGPYSSLWHEVSMEMDMDILLLMFSNSCVFIWLERPFLFVCTFSVKWKHLQQLLNQVAACIKSVGIGVVASIAIDIVEKYTAQLLYSSCRNVLCGSPNDAVVVEFVEWEEETDVCRGRDSS